MIVKKATDFVFVCEETVFLLSLFFWYDYKFSQTMSYLSFIHHSFLFAVISFCFFLFMAQLSPLFVYFYDIEEVTSDRRDRNYKYISG